MLSATAILLLAAILEVGGDAAIRHGLIRSGWQALVVGSLSLVAYGFIVNSDRLRDFGRLMGVYIAVFFLVSQVVSWFVFGGKPTLSLVVGGVLIMIGGLVIQLGAT